MSISVNDISKIYNGNEENTLNKLSFKVENGQILGLIGHNGSGKSTILKILSGVLTPSTGSVIINGNNIVHNHTYAREHIGVLLEPERSMYWRLTGFENLLRIALLKGMNKKYAISQINNYMDKYAILYDKDKLVLNYSKGMKVKLSIIAAILGENDILLLDEPLAGLDLNAREVVLSTINDFAKQGKSVVICENNVDILERMCNKVLLLNKGNVVVYDEPHKLLDQIAGEGIVEIQGQDIDSLFAYITEHFNHIYVKIKKTEKGISLLSNNVIETLVKIKDSEIEYYSINYRKKNLSDYFIMMN